LLGERRKESWEGEHKDKEKANGGTGKARVGRKGFACRGRWFLYSNPKKKEVIAGTHRGKGKGENNGR